MKESSYLSPKMAAYCQEVHQLADKFDGLEHNHIPRQLNEAADTLAKMASSRQPVPSDIFSSDQYKPSIRYEEPE
jgi:ribonuclease HI